MCVSVSDVCVRVFVCVYVHVTTSTCSGVELREGDKADRRVQRYRCYRRVQRYRCMLTHDLPHNPLTSPYKYASTCTR
jgi:hypothetical protein